MDEWCEFNQMPTRGCSHCTGRTGDAQLDRREGHTFRAMYPGRCDYGGEPISVGDEITKFDDDGAASYACQRCVP